MKIHNRKQECDVLHHMSRCPKYRKYLPAYKYSPTSKIADLNKKVLKIHLFKNEKEKTKINRVYIVTFLFFKLFLYFKMFVISTHAHSSYHNMTPFILIRISAVDEAET